ncbi:VWA domain-containing protein [Haloglomus salinum]|uniref:VWA domain-containing protein n=1 Tax=Haloglomus salinum TaxID=2962673 RepID=UPI0020CA0580|nr:VWA domain-containing protein [Haloglomus salinum]
MVEFARGKSLSGPGPPQERDGPRFDEVVGQSELKRALLAVGASDALSGLLVRGEKGTAKSTAVRALADLLPDQRIVADCPFGCHPDPDGEGPGAVAAPPQCPDCRERADPPVETRPTPLVTLPLGATRDRLVGTLSVADALDGEATFDPGLLARANRGVLYVDEVNLLDDHLVDALLDAAASGVNRVERDGVSVRHPASFTLVGTMNPEEGDLRPQFRDRFDLQATVAGLQDTEDRVRVLRGALARDRGEDPLEDETAADETDHAAQLRRARERLAAGDTHLPDEFAAEVAELCRDAGVDGHRADIATARAALAFAALDDRPRVLEPDVRRAAELALPHRLRSRPFEDAPAPDDLLDERFDDGANGEGQSEGEGESREADDDAGDGDAGEADDDTASTADPGDHEPESEPGDGSAGGGTHDPGTTPEESGTDADDSETPMESPNPMPADGEQTADGGEPEEPVDGEPGEDADEAAPPTPLLPGQTRAEAGEARAPDLPTPDGPEATDGSSGGSATVRGSESGPRIRTRRADTDDQVDAAASVRAAAARGGDGVAARDLRASVRAGDATTLVLFVVDASASMRPAMRAAKGTLLELLRDSYQARDEVGLVAFAGDGADVVLPPTDSTSRAARHLKELPTADRTPLPAGLRTASEVLARAGPDASVAVLVTDGRANVADGESPTAATRDAARGLAEVADDVLVVDAGEERGLVGTVAGATDATVVGLDALSAERVDAAARDAGDTDT